MPRGSPADDTVPSRGYNGDPDEERRVGALGEASYPAAAAATAAAAAAASENKVEGSGRDGKTESCSTEDIGQEPPQELPKGREAILDSSVEREIETAAVPKQLAEGDPRPVEGEEKGDQVVDGGGLSPGDQQPSGGRAESDSVVPWSAVLAISGWTADEIETLLRVRRVKKKKLACCA